MMPPIPALRAVDVTIIKQSARTTDVSIFGKITIIKKLVVGDN